MGKITWTIEDTGFDSGAYKASKHHARITCIWDGGLAMDPRPFGENDEQAKAVAKNGWRYFADENYQWPDTRLVSFTRVSKGVWDIVIQDAYLD